MAQLLYPRTIKLYHEILRKRKTEQSHDPIEINAKNGNRFYKYTTDGAKFAVVMGIVLMRLHAKL
ncbi:hypothetical protein FACS189487_10460 [Campylobacterota bacterium]|nr:hypothetical protein FACS189487_10460 [Campylobacterota bacterium]